MATIDVLLSAECSVEVADGEAQAFRERVQRALDGLTEVMGDYRGATWAATPVYEARVRVETRGEAEGDGSE